MCLRRDRFVPNRIWRALRGGYAVCFRQWTVSEFSSRFTPQRIVSSLPEAPAARRSGNAAPTPLSRGPSMRWPPLQPTRRHDHRRRGVWERPHRRRSRRQNTWPRRCLHSLRGQGRAEHLARDPVRRHHLGCPGVRRHRPQDRRSRLGDAPGDTRQGVGPRRWMHD